MDFKINLPIPYHSQEDPDDNVTHNTCGPTSIAMVMDFYQESHTGNEIFQKTGASSGLISMQQLITAIQAFGFTCEYKSGLSFTDIQNYLNKGIPPIVLIKAKYLTSREDQAFTAGHFFPITGYRDDGVTVNDPDFYGSFRGQGDHHFYTMQEFLNAWGKCHEDGNPDNAAIIIYPKQQVENYQQLFNQCRVDRDNHWNDRNTLIDALKITHDDPNALNNALAEIKRLQSLPSTDLYKQAISQAREILNKLSI